MSSSMEPREIAIANQRYAPTYSSDGSRVIHDHALVVRAHNPYDKTRARWALMVMGCHAVVLPHGSVTVTGRPAVMGCLLGCLPLEDRVHDLCSGGEDGA